MFRSAQHDREVTGLDPLILQRFFEIVDRLFDPLLEFHSWFPPEDFFRAANVWLAHLWIVNWQRLVVDLGFRSCDPDDLLGKLFDRHLARVAEIDWLVEIAHREPEDSVDQI